MPLTRFHIQVQTRTAIFYVLGIAALYYFTGVLSILLAAPGSSISPLWIPSGVGIAMVILYGFRIALPGIFFGSLALALHSDVDPTTMVVHMLSGLFQAALAGELLFRVGMRRFHFREYNEIIAFLFVGVILVPLAATTLEHGALSINSNVQFMSLLRNFVGNSLGVLIFTPLIMSISALKWNDESVTMKGFEGLFLLSSFSYALYLATIYDRRFLIYPFIIWAALRFSYLGVSVSSLILALASILFTETGSGAEELLWVQAHVATCAVTGHLLATVITSHQRVREKEEESSQNLKYRLMAEEALGLLDQAIQKSPIGFALVGRDMRFIRVNEFMAQINDLGADFHTGRPFEEIMPEVYRYVKVAIDHVFKTGESLLSIPVKVRSRKNPEKIFSGHVAYYPVRLPGVKQIFGVAIVFNDMTEQHNMDSMLRENQRRLNFAQEVGKMGVFDYNMITNVAIWTPQQEQIYGLRRGEFDGSIEAWLSFVHPEDLRLVKAAMNKARRGGADFSLQFRILRKDGTVRWILCRGGAMKNERGHISGYSGMNVDITDQKLTEERLRSVETELRAAVEIRDEFFAIASHELKTPLTSLKLQLQLYQRALLNNDPSALEKKRLIQLLTRNNRQTERLSRLVEDMLDVSRIRTGKLTLKRELCELSQLLTDLIARNRDSFTASGSGEPEVQIEGRAFGNWDPVRVEQVISNVLNNAIHYGKGNPIKVVLSQQEDYVRISVTDQGYGISEAERKLIFQRFERGSRTREISGMGLGLFISRQIMDAHDGRIWVESEVGKGSTFHIELPTLRFSSNFIDSFENVMA